MLDSNPSIEDIIKWGKVIKKKKSKDVFSFEIIRDTFKKGKDKSLAIKQWGHWYRQVRTDMFTPRAFISRPTNDTFPSQNMHILAS